jgi:F-type H+-transporting ATPase subunit b
MFGAAAIFTTFILILLSGQALASSGESGGGVTVIPDASVIIQIANLLFLIVALNFILYRPIRKILSDRKEKIKGLGSSTENAVKSLQKKERTLAKAIKDARARGLKEKENLVTQAEGEERKLIEAINARAQSELEETRRKIAGEAEAVRQSLQRQVETFASEITKKILGRAV